MSKRITYLLILILAFTLSACVSGGQEAAPAEAQPEADGAAEESQSEADESAAEPSAFQEAPMLTAMVEAGELPPQAERLPTEPFVVGPGVLLTEEALPDWQPGEYGGTLRMAHFRPGWNPDIFVITNEPLLIAPGTSVQGIQGNIIKDFEVSADSTEFVFHMREGLKWSDGVPVTTEDVRFTYEDVLLNEQITPSFPERFRTGHSPNGEPMTLEVIDDFTFKTTFTEPYGGLLRVLTIEKWVGYTELLRPAHYLKQFHGDYTSLEELKPLLEEQDLTDEWWRVFTSMQCLNWDNTRPRCAGFPVLNPWMVVESDEPGLLEFHRNPYYFKVDTEGQQLPYIDKIISPLVGDVEMVNLTAFAGDVDFMRESAALVKVPLYKENEEKAGIRTVLLQNHFEPVVFHVNRTFEDETWRELTGDIRFLQALSLGIDRQEIIDSIYFGLAELPEVAMGEFAARDVDRANALLDEMGLTERSDDGIRIGPDGEPISVVLEHGAHGPDIAPVSELIGEHLGEIGLDIQSKAIDSSLWGQRRVANELKLTVMWTHDTGWDDDWTGFAVDRWSGPAWGTWRDSGGSEGEEPPEWAKEAYTIDAERWSVVSGSEEYKELVEAGQAWQRENLAVISLIQNDTAALVVADNLGNVPEGGTTAIAANFAGEQFYFMSE
ncbi:MAG: ABC transporter substrate-binding protein [Chloroflexota bacterium]